MFWAFNGLPDLDNYDMKLSLTLIPKSSWFLLVVFHDKAKRAQEGNLLLQIPQIPFTFATVQLEFLDLDIRGFQQFDLRKSHVDKDTRWKMKLIIVINIMNHSDQQSTRHKGPYWPSATKYQPVWPYTDPVPPVSPFPDLLTQYLQEQTSITSYFNMS